jgi:hypothetical protein
MRKLTPLGHFVLAFLLTGILCFILTLTVRKKMGKVEEHPGKARHVGRMIA